MQNGGLLVVGKGGKLLYSFVQENFAEHASNEDILKVHIFILMCFVFKIPDINSGLKTLIFEAFNYFRNIVLSSSKHNET